MCSRRIAVRATPSTSESGAGGPPSHLVATILVQKEEELRRMIAPGQLAPRAAVIADKRKEIAALRAQLKSAVAANLPPSLASDLPIPQTPAASTSATTGAIPSQAMASAGTVPSLASGRGKTPGGTRSSNGLAAREALLLVEQQLSVASSSSSDEEDRVGDRARSALYAVEQSLSFGVTRAAEMDELAELEALQQENMLLRGRLEALEERKRQLVIIKKKIESGQIAVNKSGEKVKKAEKTTNEKSETPKRRTRRTTKSVAGGKSDSESDTESAKPKARRSTKKVGEAGKVASKVKSEKKADQVPSSLPLPPAAAAALQ